MNIKDLDNCLHVVPSAGSIADLADGCKTFYSPLSWYLGRYGAGRTIPVGSVLLVPTYRLEEVEEIIEPEKPGVPVEPYVGLSWTSSLGYRRFVVSRTIAHYEVIGEGERGSSVWISSKCRLGDYDWDNYPCTSSTPAVARKVKKWVKIEHPEAQSASHSPEEPSP